MGGWFGLCFDFIYEYISRHVQTQLVWDYSFCAASQNRRIECGATLLFRKSEQSHNHTPFGDWRGWGSGGRGRGHAGPGSSSIAQCALEAWQGMVKCSATIFRPFCLGFGFGTAARSSGKRTRDGNPLTRVRGAAAVHSGTAAAAVGAVWTAHGDRALRLVPTRSLRDS